MGLPQFSLADGHWTATVLLPSWKGFQSRKGAYGSLNSAAPSDGFVQVLFAPEGRGIEPLTDAEQSALRWVIEHEAELSSALLSSLVKEYPSMQNQYGYSPKEKDEFMPDIECEDDLRALIGLYSVNVHQVQREGIPYIGFEFGCTWDDEHGLGVLMHGTRTVAVGGADTAILLWMANQDARKRG